eukprot:Nitzschia sp. Nitz4//scaffold21_size171442//30045//31082//NITZ4_002147-RA/size171442-processed-gene-0.42-mRNA-1//-1//CDS//3329542369//315//frame0
MPLTIPAELKSITPYVRRAEELDKDKTNAESRLVAYYCRQYAVQSGIVLASSPTGKACLGDLLSSLETEKTTMAAFSRDEAKFLCKEFAEKIFDKADAIDRAGEANKATAKTFYAAASFLEILNQFYSPDEVSDELLEVKEKTKYAKWKATDILKAINEGRQPTAGGYGEDAAPAEEEEVEVPPVSNEEEGETPQVETVQDEDEDEGPTEPEAPVVRLPSTENEEEEGPTEEGTEVELGPPPAYEFAPSVPPAEPVKPPLSFSTPPPMPAPLPVPPPAPRAPAPAPKPAKSGGFFGFGGKSSSKVSKAEFADAMELTKFAMAALEDKNADLAAERLQQALQVLGR